MEKNKEEREGSGIPHNILRVERKFSSCPSKQNRIGSETGHILCSPPRQVPLDNPCSLLILNQRIRKDVLLPERLSAALGKRLIDRKENGNYP